MKYIFLCIGLSFFSITCYGQYTPNNSQPSSEISVPKFSLGGGVGIGTSDSYYGDGCCLMGLNVSGEYSFTRRIAFSLNFDAFNYPSEVIGTLLRLGFHGKYYFIRKKIGLYSSAGFANYWIYYEENYFIEDYVYQELQPELGLGVNYVLDNMSIFSELAASGPISLSLRSGVRWAIY